MQEQLPFYYQPWFWSYALAALMIAVAVWVCYTAFVNRRQLRDRLRTLVPLIDACDDLHARLVKIRTDFQGAEELAEVHLLILSAKTLEEYSVASIIPSYRDIEGAEKLIANLSKWKAIMEHPDYVYSLNEMIMLGKTK